MSETCKVCGNIAGGYQWQDVKVLSQLCRDCAGHVANLLVRREGDTLLYLPNVESDLRYWIGQMEALVWLLKQFGIPKAAIWLKSSAGSLALARNEIDRVMLPPIEAIKSQKPQTSEWLGIR